jgi:hypothetical protein
MSRRSSTRQAAPELLLALPIEGRPRLYLVAATLEDEQALRAWLRFSDALLELPDAVRELLERLDRGGGLESAG